MFCAEAVLKEMETTLQIAARNNLVLFMVTSDSLSGSRKQAASSFQGEMIFSGLLLSLLRCRSVMIPTGDVMRPAQFLGFRTFRLITNEQTV